MDAAYACFLLLGMGALLPWNALITAADYWESRWPVRKGAVHYLPAAPPAHTFPAAAFKPPPPPRRRAGTPTAC